MAVSDNESTVRDFVTQQGYAFPVMMDRTNVASQYGVRAIPTTFVIDSAGRISWTVVGATTSANLGQLVDDLTH